MNVLTRAHIAWADRRWRRRLHGTFRTMKSVGRNVHICPEYRIAHPEKVTIGNNVWIGEDLRIVGEGEVTIGSGTMVGRYTDMCTGCPVYDADDLQSLPFDDRSTSSPLVIGENCWIATHVIFARGVTVGEGAVVGMRAVVTEDVPPLAVVAGNPAKIVKYRDRETYERLKAEGKIYMDEVYDYDRSSLRRSEWRNARKGKKPSSV